MGIQHDGQIVEGEHGPVSFHRRRRPVNLKRGNSGGMGYDCTAVLAGTLGSQAKDNAALSTSANHGDDVRFGWR